MKKRQREHVKVLKFKDYLTRLDSDEYPDAYKAPGIIHAWASKKYFVQVFHECEGVTRLSVNRIAYDGSSWEAEITWDEMQAIKNAVSGYNSYAVEIYPKQDDVVNVSNMRHLWVLRDVLPFGWRNQ